MNAWRFDADERGGRVFPVRRCGDDDKRRVMDDSARTAVCARRLRSGRGMGCGELHQRDRNRGGLPFTLSGFTDFGAIHPSSWPERTFGWLSGCEVAYYATFFLCISRRIEDMHLKPTGTGWIARSCGAVARAPTVGVLTSRYCVRKQTHAPSPGRE